MVESNSWRLLTITYLASSIEIVMLIERKKKKNYSHAQYVRSRYLINNETIRLLFSVLSRRKILRDVEQREKFRPKCKYTLFSGDLILSIHKRREKKNSRQTRTKVRMCVCGDGSSNAKNLIGMACARHTHTHTNPLQLGRTNRRSDWVWWRCNGLFRLFGIIAVVVDDRRRTIHQLYQ